MRLGKKNTSHFPAAYQRALVQINMFLPITVKISLAIHFISFDEM